MSEENKNQNQAPQQKKRAKIIAIVAASDFNEKNFMKSLQGNMFASIIAADAGYRHLDSRGIVPNIVIGDFDSLGYVPKEDKQASVQLKEDVDAGTPKNIRVMQYPEDKDKTDLELAIDEALNMKPQILMIYGALGKRLDQSLSSIQMLSHIADHRVGVFCVGDKEACAVVNGPSEFGLGIPNDDSLDKTISIFSLTDVSLVEASQGLKWSYTNTAITNSMSLGVSNVITANPMKIKVKMGKILLVFSSELLGK
ncbi:MAG: thiamine diphosphokinase [Coriobacteriia bacterium]|nr:thiamine diphosphokinase [Coriobacteriia bacterium]